MGRAPPNLDVDTWPSLAQRGDVLPSLERVPLAGARPLGSSEAVRLMAAWASLKIVLRSGIVGLREADSSVLARTVHSAS